jgi:hypothetical protein
MVVNQSDRLWAVETSSPLERRIVNSQPPTHAWAQIGLAIFIEAAALYSLLGVPEKMSIRGLPMWLLGTLLIPFGVWVAVRGIRGLRQRP